MPTPGNWTLFYDWGCSGSYSSTSMTVNGDGTWSNGQGYTGLWVEVAGMFLFKFDNSSTTYASNLADLSATGMQTTFGGLSGCFYMLEAGAPTAFAEVRAADQSDSSGAS